MANILLQQLREALSQRPALFNQPEKSLGKLHFFFYQKPFIHQASECGPQAQAFIAHAKRLYREGTVSPPYTQTKIEKIYELFTRLDKDLTQPHHEWVSLWDTLQSHYHFSEKELENINSVLLSAYRRLVFSLAEFSPYGKKTTLLDECRIQDFLQRVNKYYASLSPIDTYEAILSELNENLAIDLPLDVQSLSRYLNTENYKAAVQKIEEVTSRNTMTFLGEQGLNKLYAELMQDEEFVKQLPMLAKKSKTLREQLKAIRFYNP